MDAIADRPGCAVHASRSSVDTCPRCGRFTCDVCAQASPCLECQVVHFKTARPPPPGLARAVFLLLAGYCIFTIAVLPAANAVNFKSTNLDTLTGAPMLLFMGLALVYGLVWLGLIVVFFVWYGWLVAWANAREMVKFSVPGAIGVWFVPFANFLLPFLHADAIRRGMAADVPVRWWWAVYSLSNVVNIVILFQSSAKGISVLSVGGAALEIVAAYLCWLVVRGFTAAARDWNPEAALQQRDLGVRAA